MNPFHVRAMTAYLAIVTAQKMEIVPIACVRIANEPFKRREFKLV